MPHKHGMPTPEQARKKYPHGTNARYVLGKCRCAPCYEASRRYNRELEIRKAPWAARYVARAKDWVVYDRRTAAVHSRTQRESVALSRVEKLNAAFAATDPNAFVPLDEVRRHIAWLQQQGVGIQTISAAAKVAPSVVARMVENDVKKTRRSTAARILAVGPEAIRNGWRVGAEETIILIERLVTAGYRRVWIAEQIGMRHGYLPIGRTRYVRVGNAKAIHALYVRLQSQNAALPSIAPEFTLTGVREPTRTRHGEQPRALAGVEKMRGSAYAHGTLARFTEEGCRCKRCCTANAAFEAARAASGKLRFVLRDEREDGGWIVREALTATTVYRSTDRDAALMVRDQLNSRDPLCASKVLVDVVPVREHLQSLMAAGIGLTTIAQAAGTNASHVWHIVNGKSRRIHRDLADRLLAVDENGKRAGRLVDAGSTWRLIDRMAAAGFDVRWIEQLCGFSHNNLNHRGRFIRVYRARAVMALYAAMRERIAAIRQLEAVAAA